MAAAKSAAGSAEPGWLDDWRNGKLAPATALARFDDLDGITIDAMLGRWHGVSLPTGHPLDGLLERLGWWGKAFEGPDRVHPLLFRREAGGPVPLEPALMPLGLALGLPGLARTAAMRWAFRAGLPLLRARHHAARLTCPTFRGKPSAAMVYHRLPIVDHFRWIDEDRVLGLMVMRSSSVQPFFFLLKRERRDRSPAS